MKMIYDKKLVALLDPTNMFIGDVDPLMNAKQQVAEILSQNRPLLQKDTETEENGQEPEGAAPRDSEFARPDFKLPSEEDKEREWAIIGTIFQGYKLIDPEKVKAHMKGNEPMDEELFKRVEVDIENYTQSALKLQLAIIEAEAQLKDAKQQWADAEKMLEKARLRWVDAEDTLEKARGQLQHHLDSVRGMKVTMPAPPDWGQNVYKVGERDE